jgi:hypothetical protein
MLYGITVDPAEGPPVPVLFDSEPALFGRLTSGLHPPGGTRRPVPAVCDTDVPVVKISLPEPNRKGGTVSGIGVFSR